MAKCEKCDCCDAALEIEETAYWNGKKSGTESERKRILKLITDYWCGEENCKKHGTDWEAFIKEIEDGNK